MKLSEYQNLYNNIREEGPCPHMFTFTNKDGVELYGIGGLCDCPYSEEELNHLIEMLSEELEKW